MNNRALKLLAFSFLLLVLGVVLFFWSMFDRANAERTLSSPVVTSSLIILLGASVMQIAWLLHGTARRLMKLEHELNRKD
jgi:hypothetical protein